MTNLQQGTEPVVTTAARLAEDGAGAAEYGARYVKIASRGGCIGVDGLVCDCCAGLCGGDALTVWRLDNRSSDDSI